MIWYWLFASLLIVAILYLAGVILQLQRAIVSYKEIIQDLYSEKFNRTTEKKEVEYR